MITKDIGNHDHDLLMNSRYIANAEGAPRVRGFWQEIKQDMRKVERLKELGR